MTGRSAIAVNFDNRGLYGATVSGANRKLVAVRSKLAGLTCYMPYRAQGVSDEKGFSIG